MILAEVDDLGAVDWLDQNGWPDDVESREPDDDEIARMIADERARGPRAGYRNIGEHSFPIYWRRIHDALAARLRVHATWRALLAVFLGPPPAPTLERVDVVADLENDLRPPPREPFAATPHATHAPPAIGSASTGRSRRVAA